MKKNCINICLAFILLCIPLLTACNINLNGNKLISVNMSTSSYAQTKTTYYEGEYFSSTETYIDLVYYDKKENTEYTLENFSLLDIMREVGQLKYQISGFNSDNVCENQVVTITLSSEKYSGTISTNFTINIVPNQVVNATIFNPLSLKKQYVLGESLNIQNLKILNYYSNGKTDIVNVTTDMIEGFDTTTISSQKRTMQIIQNGFTIYHDYYVVPSNKYDIFEESFVKCFVPSSNSGFTASQTNSNEYKYVNNSCAEITLAVYKKFSYNRYSLTNSLYPGATIQDYKISNINNILATVYKINYYYDTMYIIYFNTSLNNQDLTVEIIFTDYAKNSETINIFQTLLNSISK